MRKKITNNLKKVNFGRKLGKRMDREQNPEELQ